MTTVQKKRSRFSKATRERSYLKMGLVGPPNGGKSFTALRVATLLVQAGIAHRIAVIESEARKILKYVGLAPDGIGFEFDHSVLSSYSPLEYIGAIEEACNDGIDLIIIDSLTHAWAGKDGVLETVDNAGGNNKFTSGWKVGTPLQNRLIDAILQCPAHVIATIRSKVEYVLQDTVNKAGNTVKEPKKIGTAPIQREGIEYEFEVIGFFDASHVMTITKSICEPLDGAVFVKPGPEFVNPLVEWLQTGTVADASAPKIQLNTFASEETVREIMAAIVGARRKIDDEKTQLLKLYGVREFHQLSFDQAEKYLARLKAFARSAQQQQAAQQVAQQLTQPTATATPSAPTTAEVRDANTQVAMKAAPVAAAPAATPAPSTSDPAAPQTDAQKSQIAELIRRAGLATSAVQAIVKSPEVGAKRLQALTQGQAATMIAKLQGMTQDAMAKAGDDKGSNGDASEGGNNSGHAPNANGVPHQNASVPAARIVTAFEELSLLCGWDHDKKTATFASVLGKRGVKAPSELTTAQSTELESNLIKQIRTIYEERGDIAACPFPASA